MQQEKNKALITRQTRKTVSWFLYRNTAGQKGVGQDILKVLKGKNCSLGYSTQKDHH